MGTGDLLYTKASLTTGDVSRGFKVEGYLGCWGDSVKWVSIYMGPITIVLRGRDFKCHGSIGDLFFRAFLGPRDLEFYYHACLSKGD